MDSGGSATRNLYTLRNGEALRLRARLRVVRSELARRVWGEAVECALAADACSPRQGWLLFYDGTERSIGIHFESLEPHATPLSRYTTIVRTARRLKNVISDLPGIVDSSVLPHGWDSDRFMVRGQSVWMAGPVIGSDEVDGALAEATIAASFWKRIAVEVTVSRRPRVGTEIRLTQCGVAFSSGIFQPCVLTTSALGTIRMEIQREAEDMEQDDIARDRVSARSRVGIPIRVDLGTIEVPSSTVGAIVPGTVLELVTQEPSACFLQIGNRALAKGKLQVTNEGVTVTVTKVFQQLREA